MKHFLHVDNIIAAQTPGIVPVFRSVLHEFSTIIEIGFDRGAFSLWLHRNKSSDTKLVSYDISFANKLIDDVNIDFRLGDCFDEMIFHDIKSLIESPGRTLLLCDGGSKEREFELYSEFLKTGDVIMLHDYAHSSEDYENVIRSIDWRTPSESHFENIQNTIKKFNLAPYHYNAFKNVLWGSFIKQ